ncbi:glycoside hydrolase family 2 protein [Protaetiibacter mangrovi]|uniref:Beta-galactosidase n=1 Tax=Protaetiibacter mangrovi TaxID=2970926 RepID=A0ABT1ZGR6_9MICO|nr:sugar-binding domain-containing protein [Protaetiibacter mangrovi]MCS0499883.1 beta-galactosidase [Protaetiibacter mangrovi]
MTDQPRPEYPRPQFVRDRWRNLNGEWEFEFDGGDSGFERGLVQRRLQHQITVPFAPESQLSGIGDTDFHAAVWYRRAIQIPAEWSGLNVVLHFGAVDHDATIWIDGIEVGRHRGGFTPFAIDISTFVRAGRTSTLVVRARDSKDASQARGKQSTEYHNHHCDYTRTTGIWQTVWLEAVPPISLKRPRITPDVGASALHVELPLTSNVPGGSVAVTLRDAEGIVVSGTARADIDLAPRVTLSIPASRSRLWSPEDPHLYDLDLELLDPSGAVIDGARSYAGLRSVAIVGKSVLLNGRPVFQRLVLDQGYYPDGIMTAPSDEHLIRDIKLAQEVGFNGARLHQKVFEERYLYHADRLGYLVWGEFGDWGCKVDWKPDDRQKPTASYITQWLEALERDYSHPSIIGWCPLNETRQYIGDGITVLDDVTRGMFLATKAADRTRPVIDASGYSHRVAETDIYDSHNYEQDPELFAGVMDMIRTGVPYINTEDDENRSIPETAPWSIAYRGQPYFCSEFGGIWWNPTPADGEASWGYGQRPESLEAFYQRFTGLVDVLLDNPEMFGYCYTQLTDVFQEQNGLFFFDRTPKFDAERLRAVQSRTAAIEAQALAPSS